MWTSSNISFALLAILCIGSLITAVCAARFAARTTGSPLAKLRSIESKIASIEQCLDEQAESLKVVANRVKMQRVRTAANHVSDLPNAEDGFTLKDQLRKQAGLTAGKPARHQ